MGDRDVGDRGMTTISTHHKGVRNLSDLPPSLAVRLSQAQARQRSEPEMEDGEQAEQEPQRRRLRIQRVQRSNAPLQAAPSHTFRPAENKLPDWAPKVVEAGARAKSTPAIPRIQRIRTATSLLPDPDEWHLALPPHATSIDRGAPEPGAPAVSPEVAALKQELERARAEAEMWRAEAQRAQEHLEEARQLSTEGKNESNQAAAREVFLRIIPILDDLERALHQVPAPLHGNSWVEGIDMIVKHMHAVLEHAGVARIMPLNGRFDPRVHEAVSAVQTNRIPEDTITSVLLPGYILQGQVLRAAQVQVAVRKDT
jgi:molecular chaperone GrpE